MSNSSFYPEDCPPNDAKCYDKYVYMFVKHNPPTSDDTLTAYEKNRYPEEDLCRRKSLSCGKDISYLDSIQSCFPRRKKGGWLRAKVLLKDCNDGVLRQTGNNLLHYSLWLNISIKLNFHKRLEVI